ncbi:MAG TPA: hypothetical protein VE242_07660 [Chthoniobacterales bacterium]|nr:hypothetical protein [Chthoniobacterales bacterium]
MPCPHPFLLGCTICWALILPTLAEQLTPLSLAPDWKLLDAFQQTITHDEFARLLAEVYARDVDGTPWFALEPSQVRIAQGDGSWFTLKFSDTSRTQTAPRYWHTREELSTDPKRPLCGLKVALDPGHLGGAWAKMEERWFQIGDSRPVTEGDLTLRVAQLIGPRLAALGAQVLWVRSQPGPVTTRSPETLRGVAFLNLVARGIHPISQNYNGPFDPWREHSIQWEAEKLFYRVAEIHDRATIVNTLLRPDLTLCLHFNAEPWGNPTQPTLVDANHLHFIVNGGYSAAELAYADVRFAMLIKLLNGSFIQEKGIAECLAEYMAPVTRLPPVQYHTSNAFPIGETGYVWARNLLANRLYQCPVAYIECYVMNSHEFFARFQAGEYEGLREFAGVMRKNIYEEYADGVVEGIKAYFAKNRN